MILLAALLQAAPAPSPSTPPRLGPIGRQALPATGCAAYLWSESDRTLVAMASADPARLRLALDGGAAVDLSRVGRQGDGALGLAASTDYRGGEVDATLDLTIALRDDLKDGAMVPQATLRVDRAGHDTLIVPLAGVIGCHR